MQADGRFRDLILEAVPSLRAFAVSLTNNVTTADDLVQDTLLRAWAHADRFEEGSNINAWLFTILRNVFYSHYRKQRREVEDGEGVHAMTLVAPPEQQARVEFHDLQAALMKLRPDQREALLLIGAEGLSYEQAAEICGVAVGTVKSRVNRARARLVQLMGVQEDLGHQQLPSPLAQEERPEVGQPAR